MKKKIFLIIGKRFQILGLEKKINKKGEKKLRTLSAECDLNTGGEILKKLIFFKSHAFFLRPLLFFTIKTSQ